MKLNKRFAAPEAAIRLLFWLFAAACLLAAVCMPDRGQMLAGLKRICVLPYQSSNPYFAAENGGFAGTFLNAVEMADTPTARPSSPSMKLTAFVIATIQMIVMGTDSQPRLTYVISEKTFGLDRNWKRQP